MASFCPKCRAGASASARFCATCGEKLGAVEKAKKAVSGSPSANGLRSKEEANKADNDRVERALFKDNGIAKNPFKAEKREDKPVAVPAPVTFGDFVFKLVSLPGPVVLSYDDGEVIFSSKGKAEVNTELPVKRKGPAKCVKVVLKVPEMAFVANLSYNLSDGSFVTLEATEEGLKNSQLKLK